MQAARHNEVEILAARSRGKNLDRPVAADGPLRGLPLNRNVRRLAM